MTLPIFNAGDGQTDNGIGGVVVELCIMIRRLCGSDDVKIISD